jgi:hypothetical protein
MDGRFERSGLILSLSFVAANEAFAYENEKFDAVTISLHGLDLPRRRHFS